MKETRFTEEQIVRIVQESRARRVPLWWREPARRIGADAVQLAPALRRHGTFAGGRAQAPCPRERAPEAPGCRA